jgi:serine/threonine protein kinase
MLVLRPRGSKGASIQMGDFPPEWEHVRDLQPGGQGYTFVVRRAKSPDSRLFVLKRLKNINRRAYFEREIQACMALDHPNVLKIIEHGETLKGLPYLISEYCEGGSLSDRKPFHDPLTGLRFFQQIVEAVACAHNHREPIYHLDLKPENILQKGDTPVVGDFGICFIEDNEYNLTTEGPRGPIYYCAPELRGRKIATGVDLARADIYSLGKVLYWLFTNEVYDGHEDDYGDVPERKLAYLFPAFPQFAFVDELVSRMVRRSPSGRSESANALGDRVRAVISRIEAGGRVLDLRIPQRCLYCAAGNYRMQEGYQPQYGQAKLPEIERRRIHENLPNPEGGMYAGLRDMARSVLGTSKLGFGIPMFLICDYCGNVQFFRLESTQDGHGENWRP